MKRILSFLCLSFLCAIVYAQDLDRVLQQISKDSIQYNVESLQSFPTRFTFSPYCRESAFYLRDRMLNYGFEVEVDSFYVQDFIWGDMEESCSMYLYNVLAFLPGYHEGKDSSFFLGAHYDDRSVSYSYDDSFVLAPGADDNASGVACLLEIARVWGQENIHSKYGLRIEFYSGEELCFQGSSHRLSSWSRTYSIHPLGMLNLDMVGNNCSDSIHLEYYDGCDWLTNIALENIETYTHLHANLDQEYIARSDSWIFYSWGLDALFLTENDFSPYYHTPQDSSIYLDYDYMTEVTKLAASIAYDVVVNTDNVSLEEVVLDDLLKVYTQEDVLHIDNLPSQTQEIRLLNVLGKTFYQEHLPETIHYSNAQVLKTSPQNTILLLQIITPTQVLTKKFVR